jgi:hypothetical protein
MTKKLLTREQKVFKELAATGKYINTGKVLIGLTYQRKPPLMTDGEELIQSLLLGSYRCLISEQTMVYLILALVIGASLFVA